MASKSTATSMQATGTYEIKGWDEKTWDGKDHSEVSGAKLTHADVKLAFHGGIEGDGRVQFLMTYRDEPFASFVGLQQITGRIGGRSGSVVFQIEGVFENGVATETWSVVPGSGTGELRGMRGEGSSVTQHGDAQPFTLDYSFE